MKTLWVGLWFLLLYSFGAILLVFPGQYAALKWSLLGFLVFYAGILWSLNGWKAPWKFQGIKSKFSNLLNVFLVGSFLSLLAYLSYQNPISMDITSQKINKVSDSTKQVLSKIESPLVITVLADKKNWQRIDDFFKFFSAVQNKIQVKLYSPDQQPTLLQSLGIKKVPAYIYDYNNKKRVGYHLNEIELVRKTKSLLGLQAKTLCWVDGLAGVNLHETGRNGGSYLKNLLAQEGHQIISTNKPLDKCDAYVSLGFNSSRSEDVSVLKSFIGEKPILLAVDPDFKKNRPSTYWKMLDENGIHINNQVVIDRNSLKTTGQAVNLSFSPTASDHRVFQGLSNPLLLPLSTSLIVGKDVRTLLRTPSFPHSWSETDLESLMKTGDVNFSPQDVQGPISVFVETVINSQKLFVVGTSLFVTNAYQAYTENFHFFLNMVSNLLGEDILTGSRPQIKSEVLQFNQSQLNLVTYLCLIVTPLSFLLIAFYCFRQRSKQ